MSYFNGVVISVAKLRQCRSSESQLSRSHLILNITYHLFFRQEFILWSTCWELDVYVHYLVQLTKDSYAMYWRGNEALGGENPSAYTQQAARRLGLTARLAACLQVCPTSKRTHLTTALWRWCCLPRHPPSAPREAPSLVIEGCWECPFQSWPVSIPNEMFVTLASQPLISFP